MKNIKDYSIEKLKEELIKINEKPYRAEQIYKWIYEERVSNFDDMTNISLALREKLKETFTIKEFKIQKCSFYGNRRAIRQLRKCSKCNKNNK